MASPLAAPFATAATGSLGSSVPVSQSATNHGPQIRTAADEGVQFTNKGPTLYPPRQALCQKSTSGCCLELLPLFWCGIFRGSGSKALCSNFGIACDTRPLPGGVRENLSAFSNKQKSVSSYPCLHNATRDQNAPCCRRIVKQGQRGPAHRRMASENARQCSPRATFATALGLNPYKSKMVLMKEKCCREERKNEDTVATSHGNKYEDEAIEILRKGIQQNGLAVWFCLFR